MANKGDLYLDNAAVISMHDAVKAYGTTVQDKFYSQFKSAYKLSVSNCFRGDAADAFKSYLTNGAINIIGGMMDIASDMSVMIQIFAEAFYQYEFSHNGRVDESVLDHINKGLISKEQVFDSTKAELNEVMQLASKYITTKSLELGTVNQGYSEAQEALKKIREDLYEVDDQAYNAANELMTRIVEISTLIERMMAHCYNDDGRLDTDKIKDLQTQDWFHKAGNVALYLKLQEDPFEYVAGEVAVTEDQWAAGLCLDVYAYAGYAFLTASGEAGVEDGTAFAKGKAAALAANGYAQFTDYLSGSANAKFGFAEGEAKAGWSDKYKGYRVEAEVGLVKADGSVVLGSDDLNAFVKGEVKVFAADGKAAFEFEDDGEFAVGVDASASLGSASVKAGTTILAYKNTDTATGETESLLGFKAGVKAKGGGSFALWAESKTAIETEYVNINATTVKVDAALLLGLEFSVTVPTPYFKWPW